MRKIEVVGLSGRATALRIVVVSALVLLAAFPAGALATTARVAGAKVIVDGDAANNVITVSVSGGVGGVYTVSDAAGVTAGAGCLQAGVDVTCTSATVNEAIINGLDGDDSLRGSSGADTINGGLGKDFLHGGAGPDNLFGDTADGESGDNDVLNSGTGGIDPATCRTTGTRRCADTVNGGRGFDTATYEDRTGSIKVDLEPGAGGTTDDDTTTDGLIGIERIVGGMGNDELIGGLGPDTFDGGPGSDTICGGVGKDTVEYSDHPQGVTVTLDGVLATDPDVFSTDAILSLGARKDCRPTQKGGSFNGKPCLADSYLTVASCRKDPAGLAPGEPELRRDCTADDGVPGENDCIGEDIENVVGSPYDDVLVGNDPDALYGRGPRVEPAGENVLNGGGGNDVLDGSLGGDVLIGGDGLFDAASYEGRADAVTATLDGAANDGSARDLNPANNVSDQIMPDVEGVIGGNGNDILKGDSGPNVLLGGPGDDQIQGHGGGDQLGGDAGADTLEGGEGGDVMDGGLGDDYLFGGFGGDSYEGGDGSDTADFSDATTPVSVTLNGAADDGSTGAGDNVAGSIESLIGGLDNDRLNANDGDGFIDGGGGNDILNGGRGADLLVGGVGVDTAEYFGHPGPVDVSLATPGGDGMAGENDVIAGDVESIGGSAFDDVLTGDAKNNFINGRAGNDRISGAEGDDWLAGDLGNDIINGDAGGDTLDGAEGDDMLNGGAGNDTLRGFTGTDVLDGGLGADTMSGGDGVDVVSYASRSGDVTVDTLGAPDDGEKGENDQVRTDVESVRTGSGDDKINIADGAAGAATCGGGTDKTTADPSDEIGSGCEASGVRQAGICVPTSRSVKMSRSGLVRLRMTCAFKARGTIQLRSAGRVKSGKGKARRLNLGRKSFSGTLGRLTVSMRVAKSGRNVIKRKKRLRVQAVLKVRRDAANAAMRTNRTTLTLRTSGK